MNNNSPPTLIAISDLIQSHLALLQQQLKPSSNPRITRLGSYKLSSTTISHKPSSLQSYTSQQIAILHLTPTSPLPLYPNTVTPQPHPPTHTAPPTPQPNGVVNPQVLRRPPWTHLQHHLYNLGRVQTSPAPILRRRIQGPTLTPKPTSLPTRPQQPTTSQHDDYNYENLRHPTHPG
jgi:hypothetical protein